MISDRNLVEDEYGQIRLEPKAMAVLICLAAHHGKTVSRDLLFEQVWEGRSVSDKVLTRAISLLRKCLHDDPRNPRIIETISKSGYRIACEVQPLEPRTGIVIQKAPTHPLTLFNKGMAVFYSPVGSPDKGIEFMEQGWRAYGEPEGLNPHQRFWFLLLSGWLGNHYLMLESPKIDQAKEVLERALEVEPNYALIRDQLLPATKTKVFCPASETQDLTWSMLATDGSGDGTDATLADAKSLEFAHDPGKDLLWFRFSFHQMPPERAFGINIAADIDGDEGNGFSWWGGDKSLLFDRLITVWVIRAGSGDYVGTVGVGDAPSVTLGNMTNLARNEIPFLVDHEAKTIVVGVPARYLSGEGKTRILGAVGSNMTWNDDVPDGKVVQLDWSKI